MVLFRKQPDKRPAGQIDPAFTDEVFRGAGDNEVQLQFFMTVGPAPGRAAAGVSPHGTLETGHQFQNFLHATQNDNNIIRREKK
jgi:hypothetical protein